MTQNQIASLLLKLLGLYSMIEAIPLLRELWQVFAWRGSRIEMESGPLHTDLILTGILISFIMLLLVGLCLIFFSNSLAKRMTSEEKTINETTELTAKSIQGIAFSVVGLVMIVIAIPHLIQFAANYQALRSAKEEMIKQKISIGTWAYSIGLAVQVIIGILLFLGGRGLSTLWYYIQKLRPMREI